VEKSQDDVNEKKRQRKISKYARRHKEIRKYMGLSIEAEAKRSGVAASTISDMETGKTDPKNSTTETLTELGLRIAEEKFHAYGVPPEELGIKKKK
jgi:transcriptional regulator with XRE-family HTH domain